jgi:cytochrome bd-type quinol oxidase subunit 2
VSAAQFTSGFVLDEFSIGEVLAASTVSLGDDEACIEVLCAGGIRPWMFTGNWLQAKIEANNLRAARHWMLRSIPAHLRRVTSVFIVFVVGSAFLLSHASEAFAADHDSPWVDFATRAMLAAVCLVIVVILAITADRRDPRR